MYHNLDFLSKNPESISMCVCVYVCVCACVCVSPREGDWGWTDVSRSLFMVQWVVSWGRLVVQFIGPELTKTCLLFYRLRSWLECKWWLKETTHFSLCKENRKREYRTLHLTLLRSDWKDLNFERTWLPVPFTPAPLVSPYRQITVTDVNKNREL